MHYYLVTPLRIVHGSRAELTYESESVIKTGTIVMVPVGKVSVPGIILKTVKKPTFLTKSIIEIIDSTPLPLPLLELSKWMSEYYATHPVTVWQTLLPRGVQKKRRISTKSIIYPKRDRTNIVLNNEQKIALEAILKKPTGTSLLHGVTSSGKTQIYIELAKIATTQGQSVLILVPEIALTSQIIAEFTPYFPELVVTHSTMTEADRHTVWQQMLHATTPQVVIGPRSTLFSPVPKLGLIVIDECHEPSFKQEQSPRYSALRSASKLASLSGARLVLGSATPSVYDYFLAINTNSTIARLENPARKDTVAPHIEIIDMTKRNNFTKHRFFSNTLINKLTETIEAGQQSLIFHNRRGTAPTTLCEKCGWSAACPRCFIPLTLHADHYELRCHICNHSEHVPTSCPSCHYANIIHKGIGTKLLYEELTKLFPKARIARFDGDTLADETLEKQYQALYDGDIDIIIGTQVVAKGLDLPHLRMVGVVQADSGLSLPDYQSSERVFQLVSQVCGRVGRNENKSNVVVQSYQPTNAAVAFGITRDYSQFYEMTLAERKRANFPPYCHLLKIVCTYKSESAAIRASRELALALRKILPKNAELLGPTPAFYERVRDSYRWQLIVKSPHRGDLVELVKAIPATKWQYELDPASLL